jgi:hypothetical protein
MPQFPGMNPYLEGYLFQDLHSALASRIRALLSPLVRPRYAVRLEVSVVQTTDLSEDLGIVYPDVEVVTTAMPNSTALGSGAEFTSPTVTLPPPMRIRTPTVEVRDSQSNRLVTCIEILSYANKRQPGLDQYLQKRNRLIQSGVHLVEIDLIRRDTRAIADAQIPASHYRVTVTKANDRTEVWTFQMQDNLPTIPIPLLPPDSPVALPLSTAVHQVYVEADYDLTIDYRRQPPPPVLSESDQQWLKSILGEV